jgi:hypothetical protein
MSGLLAAELGCLAAASRPYGRIAVCLAAGLPAFSVRFH